MATAGCAGFSPADSSGRDPTGEGTDVPVEGGDAVDFDIETVAEGFDLPWVMEFLPERSELLVTERRGRLNLVDHDDEDLPLVRLVPA